MKKRILACLLAAVMVFGSLGTVAFAAYDKKYDVNGDGYVNPKDALELLKKYLNGTTASSSDVNDDGVVNPKDCLEIMKYFLDPSSFEDPSDTSSETSSDIIDEYIKEVVRLVNIEREKNGLAPLKQDSVLCKAADIRAEEIKEVFSHSRPDGSSCFTVLEEFDIRNVYAGENIAAGQPTPAKVVDSWMNSSGHRANILGSNFTKIGVGYFYDKNSYYGSYWVQLFTS